MTAEPPVLSAPLNAAATGMAGVVVLLTIAKVLGSATGFITGPLQARALGAVGRGDLAAVLVPLNLVPPVIGLGIGSYTFRTLPRGRRPEEVIASLGLPCLVIGAIAAVFCVPAADLLAGGRSTVRLYLIVVFVSMPAILFSSLMNQCLVALGRWRAVAMTMLIPFAVSLFGIVGLYVAGNLTVATAAATSIAGTLLAIVPSVPLLVRLGRPVFQLSMAREGLVFGVKSWAGGLASLANLRLDQFLMITWVTPRVLGLYAVAAVLGGVPTLFAGALSQPLMTRVGGGELDVMPRAVRITLAMSCLIGVVIGLISPVLLSALFGPAFRPAVPMAIVLLVAAVPLCGAMVLSSALQADGAPIVPSIGEALALIVTVVGLIVLLGPLGGLGAAIVSVAAYSTSFAFQLVMANRRSGAGFRAFMVPRRSDAIWARAALAGVAGRFTKAAARAG